MTVEEIFFSTVAFQLVETKRHVFYNQEKDKDIHGHHYILISYWGS